MTVSTTTSAADNIDTAPPHRASLLSAAFRPTTLMLLLATAAISLTACACPDGVCAVRDGSWWEPPEHISDNRPN